MKTIEDKEAHDGSSSLEEGTLTSSDILDVFEQIPKVVFACNIDEVVFNNQRKKEDFQQVFNSFGPAQFVYLPSFRRVRISYETSQQAAQAKMLLHKTSFLDKTMDVFFAQLATPKQHEGSANLLPPVPQKQFLISPPASPPVGWEPVDENKPMTNFDLLSSVIELAPGASHELHQGTNGAPSVVVHVCEEGGKSEEKVPRIKIQQTRRPDS